MDGCNVFIDLCSTTLCLHKSSHEKKKGPYMNYNDDNRHSHTRNSPLPGKNVPATSLLRIQFFLANVMHSKCTKILHTQQGTYVLNLYNKVHICNELTLECMTYVYLAGTFLSGYST